MPPKPVTGRSYRTMKRFVAARPHSRNETVSDSFSEFATALAIGSGKAAILVNDPPREETDFADLHNTLDLPLLSVV